MKDTFMRVGTTFCSLVGIVPGTKFFVNEFGGFDLEKRWGDKLAGLAVACLQRRV